MLHFWQFSEFVRIKKTLQALGEKKQKCILL
jgi:hypothetical protein